MRTMKRAIVVFMVMVLLGGIGRSASGDAGAIAGGVAVLVAGAGATYGGCIAIRAAMKPEAPPLAQPATPESAP